MQRDGLTTLIQDPAHPKASDQGESSAHSLESLKNLMARRPHALVPNGSLETQVMAFELMMRNLEHGLGWHDNKFRPLLLDVLSQKSSTQLAVLEFRLRQLAWELGSIAQTVALSSRLSKLHPTIRAIIGREIGLWQASGLPIEEWLKCHSRFRG